MRLLLVEGADQAAHALRRVGAEPQLVALLLVRVVVDEAVRRVGAAAGVVEEQAREVTRGVEVVVPVRVVGVVERGIDIAVQVVARVGDIERADLALDGETELVPLVLRVFLAEVLHGIGARREAAEVVAPGAAALLVLHLRGRGDGPVVVELDAQRGARAGGIEGVVVVLREVVVVDREVVGGGADIARIEAGAAEVVDPAGLLGLPTDEAQRRALA